MQGNLLAASVDGSSYPVDWSENCDLKILFLTRLFPVTSRFPSLTTNSETCRLSATTRLTRKLCLALEQLIMLSIMLFISTLLERR